MADDPRPTYSDKKYKTYEDFRKDVKAWRIRNGFLKENDNDKKGGAKNKRQKKRGSGAQNKGGYKPDPNNPKPGDTKKTRRRRVAGGWTGGETLVWNGSKWVKKGDSSLVPNRAVPGDEKRPEYAIAKSANESLKIGTVKKKETNVNKNVSNKENNKKNNENNEKEVNTKGPNLEEANKILSGNKKEVTIKDFQSNDKTEKTGDKKKKESRYIRNPKTRTLVRRTSAKGKQLLKIEERKRKLREKRFGKK